MNKPEEVKLEEVRKSHFDERKSKIYQKIQKSFFASDIPADEENTSIPP